MTWQNNRARIDSNNIDKFSFHEYTQFDLSRGVLLMRFLFIITVIGIEASVFLGFSSPYLYAVLIGIVIIDFLFILFHMIDSFLELKFVQGWIEKYGSNKYYVVEIGN